MNDFQHAKQYIDNAENILISTHIRPDGDAVGSLLGLCRGLEQYGKKVLCGIQDEFPYAYRIIKNNEEFLDTCPDDVDLVIIVDVGNFDRVTLCNNLELQHKNTVVFDHHPTNQGIGSVNVLRFSMSSTCEIVLEFLEFLNIEITRDIAIPLLTGVLTDTRYLTTPSATARTFRHVATLVEAGASIAELMRPIRQSKDPSHVSILSRALSTAQYDFDHALAWLYITYEDFTEFGAKPREAWPAGIFGHLINVKGVEITAHFIEMEPGSVIVEFRSFGDYDVGKVAFSFEGGGHKNASGATITGSVEYAQKVVIPELQKLYKA